MKEMKEILRFFAPAIGAGCEAPGVLDGRGVGVLVGMRDV